MGAQGQSGQAYGGQSNYGQSSGTYPGQMGSGYGGMGNYGASQQYGGYGLYGGGGQYNPQQYQQPQQNYGYQQPSYGMWGGGMPSYGQMGQQSQYVGGQQPGQGIAGSNPAASDAYRQMMAAQPKPGTPEWEAARAAWKPNMELDSGMMQSNPYEEQRGYYGGQWHDGPTPNGNMGQQQPSDFYTGNTGNPAAGVGGMRPTISGNGRSQFNNTPVGLSMPGEGLRQTGGAMPPQEPPRLNSTQILMDRAKSMQTGETPPYVPPQQAQPQPIQPQQQTIQQPPAQNYQQQWQQQLKAAQDQLNMGGAQYQPQEQKAYPEGYQFETTPSTLDPGSMAGLQSWLGGSNSPFGSTIAQQNQGYLDWYNKTYGQQAPGGPTRY